MIVKEIVERASSSQQAAPPAPSRVTSRGFPPAKHRSTRGIPEPGTRFPLRLDNEGTSTNTSAQESRPTGSSATAGPSRAPTEDLTSLQAQIDAENKARIAAMSEEERKQEAQELIERFGPGLVGLMQRRRAQHQAKNTEEEKSTVPSVVAEQGLPARTGADLNQADSQVIGEREVQAVHSI